jgi:hypothetical protein
MYTYTLSLTSTLDGGWPTPRSGRLTPGKNLVIGGCVGTRVGLDGSGKSRHPPGFDPRTVQPVVSRYTDWGTALKWQNDVRITFMLFYISLLLRPQHCYRFLVG